MAELENLDMSLAVSIEAYNYANVELDRIDGELEINARHLVAARKSLNVAQARIAERLRDLYVNGDGDSTLEVLLGSKSLDDIISRLDAIERVSSQDARILTEVKQFRHAGPDEHRGKLKDARAEQARASSPSGPRRRRRSSRSSPSASSFSPRSRTRSREMQAEERRRQAELAAQARARLRLRWPRRRPPRCGAAGPQRRPPTASRRPPIVPIARRRPDGTGRRRSSRSRCSTSACRTSGVARARRRASTARGFVSYVYAQIGISLPHHAASIYNYGTSGRRTSELQPGDLVFFNGLEPHGHVHRRRPVHPRAAHRRRREDLEPHGYYGYSGERLRRSVSGFS